MVCVDVIGQIGPALFPPTAPSVRYYTVPGILHRERLVLAFGPQSGFSGQIAAISEKMRFGGVKIPMEVSARCSIGY